MSKPWLIILYYLIKKKHDILEPSRLCRRNRYLIKLRPTTIKRNKTSPEPDRKKRGPLVLSLKKSLLIPFSFLDTPFHLAGHKLPGDLWGFFATKKKITYLLSLPSLLSIIARCFHDTYWCTFPHLTSRRVNIAKTTKALQFQASFTRIIPRSFFFAPV